MWKHPTAQRLLILVGSIALWLGGEWLTSRTGDVSVWSAVISGSLAGMVLIGLCELLGGGMKRLQRSAPRPRKPATHRKSAASRSRRRRH